MTRTINGSEYSSNGVDPSVITDMQLQIADLQVKTVNQTSVGKTTSFADTVDVENRLTITDTGGRSMNVRSTYVHFTGANSELNKSLGGIQYQDGSSYKVISLYVNKGDFPNESQLRLVADGQPFYFTSTKMDMQDKRIIRLSDPIGNQDAATKAYVDKAISPGVITEMQIQIADLQVKTDQMATTRYVDESIYNRLIFGADVQAGVRYLQYGGNSRSVAETTANFSTCWLADDDFFCFSISVHRALSGGTTNISVYSLSDLANPIYVTVLQPGADTSLIETPRLFKMTKGSRYVIACTESIALTNQVVVELRIKADLQ